MFAGSGRELRRFAPVGVVATITGTSGALRPGCAGSMLPLAVTTISVGWAESHSSPRHAAKSAARAGYRYRAVQRCRLPTRTVPAPTMTTSANPRSSAIMNRSASEKPLISPPPAAGSLGPSATTPSTLETKLAITVGRSSTRLTASSPGKRAARTGGSNPPRASTPSAGTISGSCQSGSIANPSLRPANLAPFGSGAPPLDRAGITRQSRTPRCSPARS